MSRRRTLAPRLVAAAVGGRRPPARRDRNPSAPTACARAECSMGEGYDGLLEMRGAGAGRRWQVTGAGLDEPRAATLESVPAPVASRAAMTPLYESDRPETKWNSSFQGRGQKGLFRVPKTVPMIYWN